MKKARLQTAVSVAEIVSALAVVASLLYVASEFKQSRALTSTDVQTLVYDRMLEMDRLLIENDELAEILVMAAEDAESLSPTQRMKFLAYEHIFYDSWEIAWTAHADGILEEAGWNDWNSWFAAEVRRRPLLGWTGNRQNHGEEFARFVDRQLAAD